MLNGAAISWRSKRQPTVALSSAEAEFISASAMVQEVIYLRKFKFLANLGYPQTRVPPGPLAERLLQWIEAERLRRHPRCTHDPVPGVRCRHCPYSALAVDTVRS